MSSTATDPKYSAISNINFTGGFPTSKDLAPSIIFLILYAIATPVLVWRWCRRSDRTKMLVRPSIFLLCRLGMLAIRAYMSKNTYGEGLLIAELILVSIGFLFLIEPVVSCWNLQIDSDMTKEDRPKWVRRIALILKLTLLGAIVTAITAASNISKAIDGKVSMDTVRQLREASAVLSVGVVVVLILGALRTFTRFKLDTRGTIFIIFTACNLLVVAVYRLIQTFTKDPSAPVRSRIAFWVLQMVFEFIAFALLLSVSLPTWFPGQDAPLDRGQAVSSSSDLEMARARK